MLRNFRVFLGPESLWNKKVISLLSHQVVKISGGGGWKQQLKSKCRMARGPIGQLVECRAKFHIYFDWVINECLWTELTVKSVPATLLNVKRHCSQLYFPAVERVNSILQCSSASWLLCWWCGRSFQLIFLVFCNWTNYCYPSGSYAAE